MNSGRLFGFENFLAVGRVPKFEVVNFFLLQAAFRGDVFSTSVEFLGVLGINVLANENVKHCRVSFAGRSVPLRIWDLPERHLVPMPVAMAILNPADSDTFALSAFVVLSVIGSLSLWTLLKCSVARIDMEQGPRTPTPTFSERLPVRIADFSIDPTSRRQNIVVDVLVDVVLGRTVDPEVFAEFGEHFVPGSTAICSQVATKWPEMFVEVFAPKAVAAVTGHAFSFGEFVDRDSLFSTDASFGRRTLSSIAAADAGAVDDDVFHIFSHLDSSNLRCLFFKTRKGRGGSGKEEGKRGTA